MVQKPLIKQGYSLAEEIANSVSHGIGLVFGIVGLVLLLCHLSVDCRNLHAVFAGGAGFSVSARVDDCYLEPGIAGYSV